MDRVCTCNITTRPPAKMAKETMTSNKVNPRLRGGVPPNHSEGISGMVSSMYTEPVSAWTLSV